MPQKKIGAGRGAGAFVKKKDLTDPEALLYPMQDRISRKETSNMRICGSIGLTPDCERGYLERGILNLSCRDFVM